MWELITSLFFAACMVPVVMALILGLIYGFSELCNLISHWGRDKSSNPSS